MQSLRVLFDFSLASDEPAGPRTLMEGLLFGWVRAYAHDRVRVFGPPSLAGRTAELGAKFTKAWADIPPRRIIQQQLELPLRRLARDSDVVIVPNLACSTLGLGAPVIGTLCDLRHIRRPHEFSATSRVFRAAVWTASARRMSAVVSISRFSLQEADELGFRLPEHRAVAPLGLDHVHQDRASSKQNTVVCVSHRGSKGLAAVPRLWATVRAELGTERPTLVVTGLRHDRHEAFRRAMASAGVRDGFTVTRFLPKEDLHRAIAQARAVLYLSPYEGYGLVPSEATALGTHSFVYDLPPYRERLPQLAITPVPVGDGMGLASRLIAYLRGGKFGVVAHRPPTWEETVVTYRELAERVLRLRR